MDNSIRTHPNLYTDGKVCLSILGTWNGPGWEATMSISSILMSLMSILNKNPIKNEPGYEKEKPTGTKNITYNNMISHSNIRVSVLQMIIKPPKGFEVFRNDMIKYFLKHYEWYYNYCNDNLKLNYKKFIKSPIYNWTEFFNYKKLLEQLIELKNKLILEFPAFEFTESV